MLVTYPQVIVRGRKTVLAVNLKIDSLTGKQLKKSQSKLERPQNYSKFQKLYFNVNYHVLLTLSFTYS